MSQHRHAPTLPGTQAHTPKADTALYPTHLPHESDPRRLGAPAWDQLGTGERARIAVPA
jgi:hypothetical protein